MKKKLSRKLGFPLLFLPLLGLNVKPQYAPTGSEALRAKLLEGHDTTMEDVADGSLAYIQGRSVSKVSVSSKRPRQTCLRGVKKGLSNGGVFKRYPAWRSAGQMVAILNNYKKIQKFVKSNFKFTQLSDVKNVAAAPAYSIIIYGGKTDGHIELKVPASHLIEKGFTYALESIHGKQVKVPLSELEYVYISDYIDAFPRNHPNSRVANNLPDNQRPLKAVFELRKI